MRDCGELPTFERMRSDREGSGREGRAGERTGVRGRHPPRPRSRQLPALPARRAQSASPGRRLTQQRVARARHLLESTGLPVGEVATRTGFSSDTSLRQHLHAAIGVPPLTYRRTFRGAATAGTKA
ncbi:helix-turn-helix domain-containing protein [Streptomyces sp. NPDC057747]|uniref:helix-turn-helix domain-containing protein n=2 Tax=unclassified Streptomyces TaxID=2593676 RepID=UPI0036B2C0D5